MNDYEALNRWYDNIPAMTETLRETKRDVAYDYLLDILDVAGVPVRESDLLAVAT